jgi:5-(carboxyamino)imidazole ribonucleotide mutase
MSHTLARLPRYTCPRVESNKKGGGLTRFGRADKVTTTTQNIEEKKMPPLVGIIMGSRSDWETMAHASQTLDGLGIEHDTRVLSAHRTPDALFEYITGAESRGIEVVIAAAGGAAHLAGVAAAKTTLPVLGVPMESKSLKGLDSLLSMVQMPAGIPVATLAIGRPGAVNAALFAAAILANKHPRIRDAVRRYREEQARNILAQPDPRVNP